MHCRLHLAPKGAIARPIVDVLNHRYRRQVFGCNVIVPILRAGSAPWPFLGADQAGSSQPDNRRELAVRCDHRFHRKADASPLGHHEFEAVADRPRVPTPQFSRSVALKGSFVISLRSCSPLLPGGRRGRTRGLLGSRRLSALPHRSPPIFFSRSHVPRSGATLKVRSSSSICSRVSVRTAEPRKSRNSFAVSSSSSTA